MLAFIIIFGLMLVLVAVTGIFSFVGDHQMGRISLRTSMAGVFAYVAMLCLFAWLVTNLYSDVSFADGGSLFGFPR